MTTLVFLICMANGQCIQNAPDMVFQTTIQCETAAQMIKDGVDEKMARGEIPPHVSAHKCLNWGTPS